MLEFQLELHQSQQGLFIGTYPRRALTDVDSEIQHIDEQNGEEHDGSFHKFALAVGAEDAQEATDDFRSPSQNH